MCARHWKVSNGSEFAREKEFAWESASAEDPGAKRRRGEEVKMSSARCAFSLLERRSRDKQSSV